MKRTNNIFYYVNRPESYWENGKHLKKETYDTYIRLFDKDRLSLKNWYNGDIEYADNLFDKVELSEKSHLQHSYNQGGKRAHIPIRLWQKDKYYDIEIAGDNFFNLLKTTICNKGIFESKEGFRLYQDSSLYLVLINSEEDKSYQKELNAESALKNTKSIKTSDYKNNFKYLLPNGTEEVFLKEINLKIDEINTEFKYRDEIKHYDILNSKQYLVASLPYGYISRYSSNRKYKKAIGPISKEENETYSDKLKTGKEFFKLFKETYKRNHYRKDIPVYNYNNIEDLKADISLLVELNKVSENPVTEKTIVINGEYIKSIAELI